MHLSTYEIDDCFVQDASFTLLPRFLSEKDHDVLLRISSLMKRWPDPNVYSAMLMTLLRLTPTFKKLRSVTHLARIVVADYIYKRKVCDGSPKTRRLYIKLIRAGLDYPFGAQPVIGIVVAFNLMKQKEAFEEPQIREVVTKLMPNSRVVEGSFTEYQDRQAGVHTVYLEIEKGVDATFSNEEVNTLKENLPRELKGCIEQLVPLTFMRRNEEEVYRTILTLRDQIRGIKDIPQLTISFEEQTQYDLFFTLVIVRVIKGKTLSIQQLLENLPQSVQIIPDRVDIVGSIRKIYQKEATVFRLKLPKSDFFRKDRTVDLYKARKTIVGYLTQALGPIRDFNGGLILKQNERLEDFLSIMPKYFDEFLLENFFYSITPIAMQSILPPALVRQWFLSIEDLAQTPIPSGHPYLLFTKKHEDAFLIMISSDDMSFKEDILRAINSLHIPSLELAFSEVKLQGTYCFGLLYRPSLYGQERAFVQKVKEVMETWGSKLSEERTLSIALFGHEPLLDPRVARLDQAYLIIKMLYEGLTRINEQGIVELSLADKVEISSDFTHYQFHLKESTWSNGQAIKAQDFEYSWKKTLNPKNRTYQAERLYILKNAKQAHQQELSLDHVGVKAIDDKTLQVELAYPAPFFLEVAAHWIFSLVNCTGDKNLPGWPYQGTGNWISNGPFRLAEWHQSRKLTLEKNPFYWDAKHTSVDKIHCHLVDHSQNALRLLQTGQVDLIGRPMTIFPPSGLDHLSDDLDKLSFPLFGVAALALNTENFPFNHIKIRQALSLSLCRELFLELAAHEYGGQVTSLLPTQLSLHVESLVSKANIELAKRLFFEGLGEIGFVKSDFPPLSLVFSRNSYQRQLFLHIAMQWKMIFGITIHLQCHSFRDYHERLMTRKFHLAAIEIRADWKDPLHLLEPYSHPFSDSNYAGWTDAYFTHLIEQAKKCENLDQRNVYLAQAESHLLYQAPYIPLYQLSGHILKHKPVTGISFTECFQMNLQKGEKNKTIT
jgi:ABC-type oligopeptide transport system substrate-binding subunit